MGAELGRISGPLLAENLLRQGADLAFETNLLYLDVTNGRIGIHTDTPSNTLTIVGTTHSPTIQVDTQANIANLALFNNRIQAPSGDGKIYFRPNQATNPTIVANEVRTANLKFSNSAVTSLVNNDNINFTANGTGQVIFNTVNVNVNGDLHATGDITWDGDIIIGDNDTDNVSFTAEIGSDIIPTYHNTNSLGTSAKRWKTLYTTNIAIDSLGTTTGIVNNVDLLLTQGHTIYVSVNGNDSYIGTHTSNTFRTIKHALSVAVAGDEIVVFPGSYVEDFPLTVPVGVTVNGADIRAVNISPSVSTNGKDAFLLNGESTVENLTVKDFNFDSVNNTGYGFRFANNFTVTSRSPYVRNVSVITNTSTGLAGAGALVDGSVANASSVQASMLFHSVTFIVPGADGIHATNGARVEWLNSFTYFANHGIYLTQGTLGFASLGVKFGAEMRSINSANVYGTYGAVADGANTLGYLIGHNFGYIGSGLDSQNDDKLTLQANEIVEINGGHLYYDSMSHSGDFRVGDIFYVNQQTGAVTFNAQSISFTAGGNITLNGPTGQIILDATKVQVSNIRIHDNNIDSLIGPVNFLASSGTTYLNTNVFVTGTVNVSGDTLVRGNVYLGDTPYDLVTIYPNLTQDLNPGFTNTYTLGNKTTPEIWNTAFLTGLNIDGVTSITNNTISTLTSGTDLQLQAAGTGKLQITSTDVQLDQKLTVGGTVTVNGDTSLKNTVIRSEVLTSATTAGAMNYNANGTTAYFFRVYGPLHNDPGHANYDKVQAGWTCDQLPGSIVVSNVPDPGDNNESCTITITGGTFVQNTFYTFTGNILTYGPATVTLTGDINQTGNTYITGLFSNNNISITGTGSYLQVPNIKILDNTISTTGNLDLTLVGPGAGGVTFDNKLKISGTTISNIWPSATTNLQKNIFFSPNGTGSVVVDSTSYLQIPYSSNATRTLSVNGEIRQNTVDGEFEGFNITGNESLSGFHSADKKTYITAELSTGSNDNIIRFVVNNSLRATIDIDKLATPVMQVGNFVLSNNTINNPVTGSDTIIQPSGTGVINTNGILFKDSTVSNTLSTPLVLSSTGIGYVKFTGKAGVVFPYGTTDDRRLTPETGEARYNSTLNYMEVFDGTEWIPAVGTLGAAPLEQVLDIMDLWGLILG